MKVTTATGASAQAEFREKFQALVDAGVDRKAALVRVAKENPKLHERFLIETRGNADCLK